MEEKVEPIFNVGDKLKITSIRKDYGKSNPFHSFPLGKHVEVLEVVTGVAWCINDPGYICKDKSGKEQKVNQSNLSLR